MARPGLLGLLLFFAASNFMMGTVIVLSTLQSGSFPNLQRQLVK